MGLIESIRRWIDGETTDDLLEEADEHAKPRRVWEEFLVKIAREVEACMQREMFTPPGGPTYIPREYIVYLSNDDDKEWQGDKRRGLEQGLFHVLSERARELAGSVQLQAKSFAIELRVDGTLNKGEFRVQPVWDETEAGHTMVTVRPATAPASTGAAPAPTGATEGEADTATPGDTDAGDITVVHARLIELYSIELWREGVRQSVVPITKAEITIGRGSPILAPSGGLIPLFFSTRTPAHQRTKPPKKRLEFSRAKVQSGAVAALCRLESEGRSAIHVVVILPQQLHQALLF